MTLIIISIIATVVWCYVLWGKAYFIENSRNKLRAKPLTTEQLLVLSRTMPLYSRLPKSLQVQLCGHIQVFLAEKQFSAGGELTINDNMRLLIAANACLLLLNRHSNYFTNVKSIVLYPSAYRAKQTSHQHGTVAQVDQIRIGESWPWGTIVLSWSDSLQGSANEEDGHNVILHEFAHQLDQQNGGATGTPKLSDKNSYKHWHGIFSEEYNTLRKKVCAQKRSVIDAYGATNEAEFFAVVTETFFERPLELRQQHPALYETLYQYYQVDPVSWFE